MKKKIIEIFSFLLLFGANVLILLAVTSLVTFGGGGDSINYIIMQSKGTGVSQIYDFYFTLSVFALSMVFLLITFVEFALIKKFAKKNKQLTIVTMILFCLNPLIYSIGWGPINAVEVIVKILVIILRIVMLGFFIYSNKEMFIHDKNKKSSENL